MAGISRLAGHDELNRPTLGTVAEAARSARFALGTHEQAARAGAVKRLIGPKAERGS